VIKNGLVGASMVGFEGQLTDKEIWSLSSISETPPVNMGLAWWDIERKGTYDGMRWSYGRHGWADGSRSVVKATPAASHLAVPRAPRHEGHVGQAPRVYWSIPVGSIRIHSLVAMGPV
jgi:hypothetical protein